MDYSMPVHLRLVSLEIIHNAYNCNGDRQIDKNLFCIVDTCNFMILGYFIFNRYLRQIMQVVGKRQKMIFIQFSVTPRQSR